VRREAQSGSAPAADPAAAAAAAAAPPLPPECRLCHARPPRSTVRVGKTHVSAAPLIGAPWGSMWELTADGSGLERVTQ
jgi:hypothetical protein